MSLNRVSYLESWEHQPPSFLRREDPGESSELDDSASHDLPDPALLSSSLPSAFGHQVLRKKWSFNPAAAPGWKERSIADSEDLYERETAREALLADIRREGDVPPETRERLEAIAAEAIDARRGLAETTGAFEVNSRTRIIQVCTAVIYCLLSAGVVFGFAAIKPVLIDEGVYQNRCTEKELESGSGLCYGQESRLNLMFTVAAVATNVCALPVGTILDTYGPKVTSIIGSFFLALGSLLFALAPRLPFDGFIPGYLFLALGGPFVFISSFHLSNTFPARSGLILSMLTGAFDSSSAVFLIFRLLHEKTEGAFGIQHFFLLYLFVPVFILIVQLFVMPTTSYKTVGELVQQAEKNIVDEARDAPEVDIADTTEREQRLADRRHRRESIVSGIHDLLGNDTGHRKISDLNFNIVNTDLGAANGPVSQQAGAKTENKPPPDGVWGVMHGYSALQQVKSPWFVFIALFTVLQMLRINYFVATIFQQYSYLLGSTERARQINQAFDLFLPLGGIISIPFIGTILDSTSTTTVLSSLVVGGTLIGVLGSIPHRMGAAYANITLFTLYRPFYYTAVSDYSAKVFGFQTFGKVYGLVICLAGMGNFAQAGLDALTFKVFSQDPVPVNLILTLTTCAVGIAMIIFVWWRSSARAAELSKATNGLGEEERLLPGSNGERAAYGSTAAA